MPAAGAVPPVPAFPASPLAELKPITARPRAATRAAAIAREKNAFRFMKYLPPLIVPPTATQRKESRRGTGRRGGETRRVTQIAQMKMRRLRRWGGRGREKEEMGNSREDADEGGWSMDDADGERRRRMIKMKSTQIEMSSVSS
jgi:hypothetical protein